MNFCRIRDIQDPRLERCRRHYRNSFPYHEQREEASQASIMTDEEYFFQLLLDGEEEVGAILCWETAEFIYVEHFYIYPEFRGNGYGSAALKMLHIHEKTVILEIDPPEDAVSIRRKMFYERCGFVSNPYSHIHPPYHKECAGHELVVMSYPESLTQSEYDSFYRYLTDRVMAGAY